MTLAGGFRQRMRQARRVLFRARLRERILRRPGHALLQASGWRPVRRKEIETGIETCKCWSYGQLESVQVSDPIGVGGLPEQGRLSLAGYQASFAPAICGEFESAVLAGEFATGFDRTGRVVLETTPPIYETVAEHLATHVSLRACRAGWRGRAERSVDLACSLVHSWSRNYWHWTMDSLTRMEAVERYAASTGRRPKLIVDAHPTRFQREMLAALGYPEKEWVRWRGVSVRVGCLLVPCHRRSFDGERYGVPSPSALRWLGTRMREGLGITLNPTPRRRVYISRREVPARRVLNEQQLIEMLKPLGFTVHVLGELSFHEQVALFADAETIISPHGAGLTNLIYAGRPKVVELFGGAFPRCYSVTARNLGFAYGAVAGRVPAGDLRGQDADFHVPLQQLRDVMEMMEVS